MQQINIVISGFDPYEGVDVNPAMLVPQALAERWRDPSADEAGCDDLLQDVDVAISTVMLPVSFANAWPWNVAPRILWMRPSPTPTM